jgi:hypothetical protein
MNYSLFLDVNKYNYECVTPLEIERLAVCTLIVCECSEAILKRVLDQSVFFLVFIIFWFKERRQFIPRIDLQTKVSIHMMISTNSQ